MMLAETPTMWATDKHQFEFREFYLPPSRFYIHLYQFIYLVKILNFIHVVNEFIFLYYVLIIVKL